LVCLSPGGYTAVSGLCRLDQQRARRQVAMLRTLAGGILLAGSAASMFPLFHPWDSPHSHGPMAWIPSNAAPLVGCAVSGVLGCLWLLFLSLLLDQLQQAFLL